MSGDRVDDVTGPPQLRRQYAPGIVETHRRRCALSTGSAKRCDCAPSYTARVKRDGRTVRETFPTPAEALAWAATARQALRYGPAVAVRRSPPPSFERLAVDWAKRARQGLAYTRSGSPYAPATVEAYETAVRLRALDFPEPRTRVRLGDLPASSFDARLVGLLVRDTTERDGAARARQLAAAVSAVLRDGFERGLLEELPPRVQLPPPPAGRVVSLTFAEAEKLLQAAQAEDTTRKRSLAVPLVALLLDTGLRLGEALGLDYGTSGLDLSADPPVARVGRGSTKTDAGARTVTLGAEAASVLRRHRLASGRPADGSPVFADEHGRRLDRHGRVRGTMQRVAEAAGLDSLRAHGLRHAHATFLARADVPPHAAAARLGHADGGALFLRVYAHPHADDERAALEAVERLRESEKKARGALKVRSNERT